VNWSAAALRAALGLSQAPEQATVDELVEAARASHVPVALVVAVCQVESGLGTRGAILCGCGGARGVRAQARCAARTLAVGRRLCGGWGGALRRYRYGGCPRSDPRAYVRRVEGYERAATRSACSQSSGSSS
jgi:hypothetical protein